MHHAPVKMGDAAPGREASAGASPSLALEAHPTSQVANAMGQLGAEVCIMHPILLIRAWRGKRLQPG